MTRTTNARLAGSVLLLYIVTGVASMVLFGQATSGGLGTAGKLASLAQHASLVRVTIVLTLLQAAYALGITLAQSGTTQAVIRGGSSNSWESRGGAEYLRTRFVYSLESTRTANYTG